MNNIGIIELLTAFGLGSIVTAMIQSWLGNRVEKRNRSFGERKAAYVGLLEAYHRAAVEGTDEAAKEFAYWQMRCDLVAPKEVRHAIQQVIDTNDNKPMRQKAHTALKTALRNDLDIGID